MRIAVIGGGAAAVSLLDSLLSRLDPAAPPLDITVYEGSGELGRGRAYRPDLDSALVNRQAGYMSIRCDDRTHFLRWLQDEPRYRDTLFAELPIESYAPRRLFGEYLAQQWVRCEAEARTRGWRVQVVHGFATAISRDLTIVCGETTADYDRVVLCVGTGGPTDPYGLSGAPGFHPDTYPLREVLPRVRPDAPVAVLGAGLSGVDTVLGLLHLGHQGEITMVSRRGALPGARSPQRPHELVHLTPAAIGSHPRLSLAEVWRLLRAELTTADIDPDDELNWPGRAPAHEFLRHQLSQVDGNPMQSMFMAAMHAVRQPVWSALNETARRTVVRRFNHMLKCVYNPMPPSTARALLAAMESGQLRVVSGVGQVSAVAGGFRIEAAQKVPDVTDVVDATRAELVRVGRAAQPILHSVVAAGLGMWNPVGGMRLDPQTMALNPAPGTPGGRVFAVGELGSGDLYYASSMFMINRCADVVAEALAGQLSEACARAPEPQASPRARSREGTQKGITP